MLAGLCAGVHAAERCEEICGVSFRFGPGMPGVHRAARDDKPCKPGSSAAIAEVHAADSYPFHPFAWPSSAGEQISQPSIMQWAAGNMNPQAQ